MKGAYVLIIRVEQPVNIQIKSLGEITFETGWWAYVGSAMGTGSTSLENRLSRHFRREKTIYWHIDYLLDANTELAEAIWAESSEPIECSLAQSLAASDAFILGPKRFGSSDCHSGCTAHIYLYHGEEPIHNRVTNVFRKLSLEPQITKSGQL
jgi:sugar fermentation stimulation protein A